jgi:uncharacterized protein
MSILQRYLYKNVKQDLKDKMVFVGGPRQVGKTVFSLMFLDNASVKNPAYLNWDSLTDKSIIKTGKIPSNKKIIVLDEIHKFPRWRGILKGLYDKNKEDTSFLVTGSARLDHYRKGGDSLQGRYYYYRLHPFSLNELAKKPTQTDFEQLFQFGGFPEPLIKASSRFLNRWHKERLERVIYQDIRDLESLREVGLIELLIDALPARIGSPLSMNSLAEDIEVSPKTIKHWLDILDKIYLTFRLLPFGAPKIRAVKKEQKCYFWDWAMNHDKGEQFENMIACQLLKYCHYYEDVNGEKMELRYLRDTDKREVDFIVLKNKKPLFAVEAKYSSKQLSSHLSYFQERVNIPHVYQVHADKDDYGNTKNGGRTLPFWTFCRELSMP